MKNKEKVRINKFISQSGFCSRRKAEELIKNNKVKINGKLAILGQIVNDNDLVTINDKKIFIQEEKKYYLVNKPKKVICSLKDNFNRKIITDLIDDNDYLFPIGRLDYNTTGAIIVTNDGEIANKLMHPSFEIERTYQAKIDKKLSDKELLFLNNNEILINNKKSKQKIFLIDDKSYLIKINQGSYHHVKLIFEHIEKKVIELKRISFAGLTCEGIPLGGYRKLKPFEIKKLKSLFQNS